jgi:hypothetical protein
MNFFAVFFNQSKARHAQARVDTEYGDFGH